MGINLEKLADALKVDITFTDDDKEEIFLMRNEGLGLNTAMEEIFAKKILKKIAELVEKVEKC